MATINTPAWFAEVQMAYGSGEAHCFLLTGDLNGYVEGATSPRRFLESALSRSRGGTDLSIVARYDLATGITFPAEAMRAQANLVLGASEAGQGATSTPAPSEALRAALGALGPQQSPNQDRFAGARSPVAALGLLDRLARELYRLRQLPDPPAFASATLSIVVDEAHTVIPQADVAAMSPDARTVLVLLKSWARDGMLADGGTLVLLLAPDLGGIHAEVRAASTGWRSIDLPLPDEAARLAWIDWYLTSVPVELRDLTPANMARLTAGLSLRHIEDILLRGSLPGVTRAMVKARKDEIIRQEFSEIASMLEPLADGLAELGGLDQIKAWFGENVATPLDEGRVADVPKGVLLVGPPGTGKTLLARGLAGSLAMNCVQLLSDRIQTSLVGESERKLAQFFGFCKALAPTLVFVDEIDQSDMGNRGDQSGNPVAKNLFNQVLQFMSDESNRGRVIVIFASNRPDKLDPALLRQGRMDAVIPVLLPEMKERGLIACTVMRQRGCTWETTAVDLLERSTDKYSSADVAALANDAARSAKRAGDHDGSPVVSLAHMAAALDDLRPNSPTTADFYTRLAVAACNRRSLLPPHYRALLDDRPALAAQNQAEAAALDDGPRGRRAWS